MSKSAGQVVNQVFISVQRRRDPRQETFLSGILAVLKRQRLMWITIDRDEERETYEMRDPLPGIRDALSACQGAIVIAFERWRFDATVEYPAAPYTIAYGVRRLPTVWNQIEAAMAFQAGLPLLVLVEAGLHQQGMTNPRRTAIQVASFTFSTVDQQPDDTTRATVEAWCRRLSSATTSHHPADAGKG